MNPTDLLARIDHLRGASKRPSDAAISRAATGSADTIRNWRRAVKSSREFEANTRTYRQVAEWLDQHEAAERAMPATPDMPAPPVAGRATVLPAATPGFSAPATMWLGPMRPAQCDLGVAAALVPDLTRPHFFTVLRPIEAYHFDTGDVLIVDMITPPRRGDMIIARRLDDPDGQERIVGLCAPPYVHAAVTNAVDPVALRIGQGLAIDGRIVASFRPPTTQP